MIRNSTRGTVLCKTFEVADSPLKKARGLMFRESLPRDHGMLFRFPRGTRSSMWMLFMRFPIDILFLDKNKRILSIAESALPLGLSWRTWRLYSSPSPAHYVLELPAGRSSRTNTRVGDVLDF